MPYWGMTSAARSGPDGVWGDRPASADTGAHADSCGAEPAAWPEVERASGQTEPLGGDPACWLNRVCDACGRFVEDEAALTCPACGAAR